MGIATLVALVVVFPLAGAIVNGLFGRYHGKHLSSYLACGAMAAAFACSLAAAFGLSSLEPAARTVHCKLYSWIDVGTFNVDMAFTLDPLSAMMILVVTGVGFLIHVYSIGYMAHDDGRVRYFAYLNLFVFFMLVLVLGSSLPVLFLGWEGVGLCSYLLIGFWFDDAAKATAGKKAFLTNRVGDMFFVLGMLLLFWSIDPAGGASLAFADLKSQAPKLGEMTLGGFSIPAVVAFCLFVGATGKSAQIPLYVWLPDAMAGPTPVSALIHAATMVTAGVYMTCRMSFLFEMAPSVMTLVAWTGALTAFFAATIALAATDIKKVLAYSTVSQLGYMFLGVGCGGYVAGLFHLVTHAFFKGLLFLGSGSVIHGCGGNQDIRKMGGLSEKMPWTFWTFAIGTWAIAGLPPFAGFFSKDEVLGHAFGPGGSTALWVVGLAAAVMTAFYMVRLFVLVFLGTPRMTKKEAEHVHESPMTMTAPLAVLALLSAIGGALNLPHFISHGLHLPRLLDQWLAPVFAGSRVPALEGGTAELIGMAVSILAALAGTFGALYVYWRSKRIPAADNARVSLPVRIARDKWYVDEVYGGLFVQPLRSIAKGLAGAIDSKLIDRTVSELPPAIAGWFARALSELQNGNAQRYAIVVFSGALGFVFYMSLHLPR